MLRIDRITLMMVMSVENSELTLHRLNEMYRAAYEGLPEHPQDELAPWRKFYSGQEQGRHRYSFDVTGSKSDLAAMTLPPSLWSNVRRLDYKWVGNAAPINWTEVYKYIESVVPSGTRLSMFGSKLEEKKSSSSLPPGRGIRIGSHESDRSMVIYQKGTNLSIEVQLQKKAAKSLADDCVKGGGDPYDNARQIASGQLNAVLKKAGFASISHLVGVLETDAPVRPSLFQVDNAASFYEAKPIEQAIMMLSQVLDKLREIADAEVERQNDSYVDDLPYEDVDDE